MKSGFSTQRSAHVKGEGHVNGEQSRGEGRPADCTWAMSWAAEGEGPRRNAAQSRLTRPTRHHFHSFAMAALRRSPSPELVEQHKLTCKFKPHHVELPASGEAQRAKATREVLYPPCLALIRRCALVVELQDALSSIRSFVCD